jgi:hypothetical protein
LSEKNYSSVFSHFETSLRSAVELRSGYELLLPSWMPCREKGSA